jgi:hypothetical protein
MIVLRWLTADSWIFGWGGRIRTPECMDQNHVSYRLTTPQIHDHFVQSVTVWTTAVQNPWKFPDAATASSLDPNTPNTVDPLPLIKEK